MIYLQNFRNMLGIRHVIKCSQQTGRLLAGRKICKNTVHNRELKTSIICCNILDARDKETIRREEQVAIRKAKIFDEVAQNERNKENFQRAVHKFNTRHDRYRRGNVEFMYAAMERMKEFNVHRDLSLYKEILQLLPKDKMVARTMWQVEMMHYPKQQQCVVDLLDQMELNGVVPDDELGYMLRDRFGDKVHAFRKYQRMMYWMPKFKHANPYPVPYELPEDPVELARLALQRMAMDRQNKILNFETSELKGEDVLDETFVVSAQSPDQQELLYQHNPETAVYVEGGFTVWLRRKSLTYFILKADTTDRYTTYTAEQNVEKDEFQTYENFLQDIPFFNTKKTTSVMMVPTVHEQDDGTILAMCITGTGSKNSLASWIKWLQETNPKLAQIPVVFKLKTPETGLTVIKGEDERKQELAPLDFH